MDAVDAALVRFSDRGCELLAYHQYPLPTDLFARLQSFSATTPVSELAYCDRHLGDLFAESAIRLVDSAHVSWSEVAAIGCHGQTVLHCPDPIVGNTLQLGDPNRIAWRTGVITIADFRRMDMAAGGQGAPLAPAFHAFCFRDSAADRIVLNIGGIANITILPKDTEESVSGFDTGPGNVLLDQWIGLHCNQRFDRDGNWGADGRCNEDLLLRMLGDDYFSRHPPKSTGKERFNLEWINQFLPLGGVPLEPRDMQATLTELTCRTIADAITTHAPPAADILVCGGGVHNALIMRRLRKLLPRSRVGTTAAHGIEPDAVEAATFAWLAKRRLEGAPGNLPSVTGAGRAVVLGAVYEPGKVQSE